MLPDRAVAASKVHIMCMDAAPGLSQSLYMHSSLLQYMTVTIQPRRRRVDDGEQRWRGGGGMSAWAGW